MTTSDSPIVCHDKLRLSQTILCNLGIQRMQKLLLAYLMQVICVA